MMSRNYRIACAIAAFATLELFLMCFIDRPISTYMRAIEQQHPAFTDIFRAYTDLGKAKGYLVVFGAGFLLCAALVRWNRLEETLRQKIQNLGEKLLFLFSCLIISGGITDILKILIGRTRPVELDREHIYGFHPLSFAANWHSFPSGHSTTAFALATALAILFPRARIFFFFLGFVLAISRIIVNAHFMADVIAGATVGIISALALKEAFNLNGMIHLMKRIFPIDKKTAKP